MRSFDKNKKRDPMSILMAAEALVFALVLLIVFLSSDVVPVADLTPTMPNIMAGVLLVLSVLLAAGAFFEGISYTDTKSYGAAFGVRKTGLLAPAMCLFGGAVILMRNDIFPDFDEMRLFTEYFGMTMFASGFCMSRGGKFRRYIASLTLVTYPILYIFAAAETLDAFRILCGIVIAVSSLGNLFTIRGSRSPIYTAVSIIIGFAGAAAAAVICIMDGLITVYVCLTMLAVALEIIFSLYIGYKHPEVIQRENRVFSSTVEKTIYTIDESGLHKSENSEVLTENVPKTQTPEKDHKIEERKETDETRVKPKNESETASDRLSNALEFLNTFPSFYAFVYYPHSDEIFRYRGDLGRLNKCAGTEPHINALVAPEDRKIFETHFASLKTSNGNDHSSFLIKMWHEKRNEFRSSAVRFYRMDDEIEAHARYVILVSDAQELTEEYTEKEKILHEKISDYKAKLKDAQEESQRIFLAINEMMLSIIEKKSHESQTHIRGVSRYTSVLLHSAQKCYPELELKDEEIKQISSASIMHDIGKIDIPDDILNKEGQYEPDEFEIMKKHPIYGADIINRMPFIRGEEQMMSYAREIALHHHERIDGSGYPDMLKGDAIPFYVQLVSIADVYEAMTASRSYRNQTSYKEHTEVIRMISEGECGAFSEMAIHCLDSAREELLKAKREIDALYDDRF